MSNYEQFNLFSGNFELDLSEEQLVAPRVFKSTPSNIIPKPQRLSALYDVKPGSVLYTTSIHRPVKLLVLENENQKITCKKIFDNNHYVPNRAQAEASFEFNEAENHLYAVAESDGFYFFSQNKNKPLQKVSANLFTNYVNEYFSSGRTNELLVFRAFFSHFIDTTTEICKANNPFIAAYRKAQYYSNYGLPIGYWDNNLSMDYKANQSSWEFNCFGTELTMTEEEALAAYKEFIKAFEGPEFDINSLSDLHLIAFYKFQGFDVRLNFLTFEWTIKHAASTKTMYIEREELLEPKTVIEKWTNFATLKNVNEPKILRGNNFDFRFIDKHIPKSPLKAFSIPANTTLHSETLYNLTGHRHFVVLEDLGKQVRLAPIKLLFNTDEREESFENIEYEKEILIPRTHIKSATLKSSDNNKSLCQIPYGIPSEFENSSDTLLDAIANYPNSLNKLELLQLVAFNVIRFRHDVIQAIKEKDVKVAVAQLKKDASSSYGFSSMIPGMHNTFKSNGIFIQSFRCDFSETYAFKEIVETYWSMLKTIERFEPEEYTLGELILYYHLNDYSLSLTGVPSFFYFEGKGFHTSKYNPTNIQEMLSLLEK